MYLISETRKLHETKMVNSALQITKLEAKHGHEANKFKDLLALLDPLDLPALPDQLEPLALLVSFFQVLFKFANILKGPPGPPGRNG